MPGIDWIPGVSHMKALLQTATGDAKGAIKTLDNFHKECPIFSHLTSLAQIATGDTEGALESQKRCLGAIHHIVGDHEGGIQAFNAAT